MIVSVSDFYEFTEFPADVIEYTIKNNFYSVFVELAAKTQVVARRKTVTKSDKAESPVMALYTISAVR